MQCSQEGVEGIENQHMLMLIRLLVPQIITFSLERKIVILKVIFSSLLVQKLYCVFPEAKKRSWSMLDIFTIYIPMSTKMDWTHMFNSH